ncbi:outer dynein arm-docking complex subunit 4 isoform X2 [Melospiza melodia melodia]|uniref:outer dynein arm-docking complex subunit 4 isoform X2 n=1 Tax=Melospiza melodia melodia TaxID=1914991 RepID=UPI002FCFF716
MADDELLPVLSFGNLMSEGIALSRRGQHEKALGRFNDALKLRGADKHCLITRSKCFLRLGDTENSLKDAEASLQIDDTFYELQSKKDSQKQQKKPKDQKDQKHTKKKSPKTEQQLLGRLYDDKAYLEKLLKDEDLMQSSTRQGTKVMDLVMGGISYLNQRRDFWQQQKPMYAREYERKLLRLGWGRDRKLKPAEIARAIAKEMEDIEQMLARGSAEQSCRKAEHLLKKIRAWSEDDVPNKYELIGNLHSCIGNAQLAMGQMEAALHSHKMDLECAREHSLTDSVSRALDNIGHVYARLGKFQQAISTWEEKIPLAQSSLEKAWLFHEIGRCYLELDNAEVAQDYGEQSLQSADEEGDVEWQLHATVLVAQAQVKLKNYPSAILNFERALEKARLLPSETAQNGIIAALDNVSKSLIAELNKGQKDGAIPSHEGTCCSHLCTQKWGKSPLSCSAPQNSHSTRFLASIELKSWWKSGIASAALPGLAMPSSLSVPCRLSQCHHHPSPVPALLGFGEGSGRALCSRTWLKFPFPFPDRLFSRESIKTTAENVEEEEEKGNEDEQP